MTARVITDPSALGWVLDPDTGRWEWSGSSDGGGESSSDPWELLHEVDMTNVSMLDYPDIFSDEYVSLKVEMRSMYLLTSGYFWGRAYSNGALVTSRYARTTFDPVGPSSNVGSRDRFEFHNELNLSNGGVYVDLSVMFSGINPDHSPNRAKQPILMCASTLEVAQSKNRQVVVGMVNMPDDWADWDGFQINTQNVDSGKALIYGLKRD